MSATSDLTIPTSAREITEEWLTDMFSRRYSGVEVTRIVEVDPVDTHVSAAMKWRFGVEYNDAGREARLPTALCMKASFETGRLPADASGWTPWDLLFVTEASFYRDIAPTLPATIRIPGCCYADTNGHNRCAMLLDDLVAAGATFGAFDRPLAADTVAATLEMLAELHASWWGSPDLWVHDWMDNPVQRFQKFFLNRETWETNVLDNPPRAALLPPELADIDMIKQAVFKMWHYRNKPPLTLLHGDPHIGNMFFLPDGKPGFLDWQVACRGPYMFDVGYFMTGAMETEERRKHDLDLLRHYLAALASHGVDVPSWDESYLDFRRWQLHGFLNFKNPASIIQSEEYSGTIGRRFGLSMLDHDTLGALEKVT
jgi:Phosphotransferase enzyme family